MASLKMKKASPEMQELFDLITKITSDGRITNEEIAELTEWMNRNNEQYHNPKFPSFILIFDSLTSILEDGEITQDERDDLWAILERVMPPEQRKGIKAIRKAAKDLDKRFLRVHSIPVVGLNHPNRDGGDRRRILNSSKLKIGDAVTLVREPKNQYDSNAIAVYAINGQIGYVPAEMSSTISDEMKSKDGHYCAQVVDINDYGPRLKVWTCISGNPFHLAQDVACQLPLNYSANSFVQMEVDRTVIKKAKECKRYDKFDDDEESPEPESNSLGCTILGFLMIVAVFYAAFSWVTSRFKGS